MLLTAPEREGSGAARQTNALGQASQLCYYHAPGVTTEDSRESASTKSAPIVGLLGPRSQLDLASKECYSLA
jgi:hypothetical protein